MIELHGLTPAGNVLSVAEKILMMFISTMPYWFLLAYSWTFLEAIDELHGAVDVFDGTFVAVPCV